MKELNDQLISDFEFKDKELAKRLRVVRDTLISIISNSKYILCEHKQIILNDLSSLLNRLNPQKKDQLCTASGIELLKEGAKREFNYRVPNNNKLLLKLHSDLENIISYVITNKFCVDLELRIDLIEKYVKDLVNGVCGSDDWEKPTTTYLNYLLMKTFSYFPGSQMK